MLNCREIAERSSDFVDGALPWHVRVLVRMHLSMCRICREYVRQMRLVVAAIHRLQHEEPSVETQHALIALFRTEHS